MLKSLVRTCDVMGASPALQYRGHDKFKSILGGILTILYLCITLAGVVFFGSKVIDRSNPSVTFSKAYQKYGNLSLTGQFPIMAALSLRGGIEIPNVRSYFNITMLDFRIVPGSDGKPNRTNIYYRTGPCETQDFAGMANEFMDLVVIKNMSVFTCLKQNQPISSFGTIGTSSFSYLLVNFNMCANGTDIVCKPQSEIDTMAKSVYLNFLVPDIYFNANIEDKPGNLYPRYISGILTNTVYKKQYLYYKNVQYNTDKGFLTEDTKGQDFYQFDTTLTDINIAREAAYSNVTLSEIIVTATQIQDVYYRSYYKIQNMLADLGGIINLVMLIFVFVNQFVNQAVIKGEVFNDLFHSIGTPSNLKKIQENPASRITSSEALPGSHDFQLVPLSSSKSRVPVRIITDGKSLKFKPSSECDYKVTYKNVICCCTNTRPKKNAISKLCKVYDNYMDIRSIIQSANDVETLKLTIFNQDQFNVFNYAAKISWDKHVEPDKGVERSCMTKSYNRIKNVKNECESHVNLRLIQLSTVQLST